MKAHDRGLAGVHEGWRCSECNAQNFGSACGNPMCTKYLPRAVRLGSAKIRYVVDTVDVDHSAAYKERFGGQKNPHE